MTRFVSALSKTVFLAIVSGSFCLVCFVRATPIFASEIPTAQGPVCEENQNTIFSTSISSPIMQTHAASECQNITENVALKTRVSTQPSERQFRFIATTNREKTVEQARDKFSVTPNALSPQKDDRLTGIIIKRE